MKSWQDRWKAELDASLPELKPEVLNAPIPVSDEENPAKRTKTAIFVAKVFCFRLII